MDVWDFSINTFNIWIFIGIIVVVLLFSNMIRRKVGFIRKSLLPTAVIAGLLVLIIKTIVLIINKDLMTGNFFEEMKEFMEALTYHGLGLGVVALSLKINRREKSKEAQRDVFNAGLVTVNTYLIQAIVGTVVVLLLVFTFMGDLFPASGLLLPLGFGQGTGQAFNFGSMFENEYGFVGGKSFGLTIAMIGFLGACLVGVLHMFVKNKKGLLEIKGAAEFESVEIIASPNEVPVTEAVDRLTIQVALIALVYFLTFMFMYGIESLDIGNFGTNTLKPLVWGFNFLIGSIFAVALKGLFNRLKKRGLMTRDYPNDYLLNRISGLMFDIMIVAGIIAIEIEVLVKLVIPLLLITSVGTVVTYYYVRKLSYTLFPKYKDEAFLSLFGMLTGTVSTGMILLREVDPKFETPASSNLVYQSFYAIALGFPLFLLLGYAPKGLTETLISLGVIVAMFVIFNLILFRAQLKNKYKNKVKTSE